jgi:microcystin-dependent protein
MDFYLAEIRLFATDFVPRGWLPCEGQLLAIAQHQALFSLLGTTYGGDGVTRFAVPDLRGRVPVAVGTGTNLGQVGGERAHALTPQELPAHRHGALGSAAAAHTAEPGGARWAATDEPHYAPSAQVTMAATTGQTGGSQPHENMPPYLALSYAIATEGLFPSSQDGMAVAPFCAEIRLFAGARPPGGWALCQGQLIPIAQNTAVFALLGTTYGGDGRSTFALPDLRDRTPVHAGQQPGRRPYAQGAAGGSAQTTLSATHLPPHGHQVRTAAPGTRGTTGNPSGAAWAVAQQGRSRRALYGTGPGDALMPEATAASGAGAPHNNLAPYVGVHAMIALSGVFPQRS